MSQIIILNGPAGVGKTTVGQLLATKFKNSVCISGDSLKEFIINRTNKVKVRLGYKNGASLVNNFLDAGYEWIIFEYVFPSKEQIRYFLHELGEDKNVSVFTLWAPLNVLEKRAVSRKERDFSEDQITNCHAMLSAHLDDFENVIETETLSAETLVINILRLLRL